MSFARVLPGLAWPRPGISRPGHVNGNASSQNSTRMALARPMQLQQGMLPRTSLDSPISTQALDKPPSALGARAQRLFRKLYGALYVWRGPVLKAVVALCAIAILGWVGISARVGNALASLSTTPASPSVPRESDTSGDAGRSVEGIGDSHAPSAPLDTAHASATSSSSNRSMVNANEGPEESGRHQEARVAVVESAPSIPRSSDAALAGGAQDPSKDFVVDVNRASAEDFRRLPGIGVRRAQALVALRERLGRFRRVEDLLRVRGIGRKMLQRLRPHLRLDSPDASAPPGLS